MPARNVSRVVVTAGASGIGLAIALEFLETGANVWVCDVDAAAIAGIQGLNPLLKPVLADVSDPAAVDDFFIAVLRDLGGIDVLVNNAGVAGPTLPTEAVSPAEWDRCFAVNVAGMFHCCRAVIPAMKAQHDGCIINISTASVRTGLPLRTPYVASKYAVHGLTVNLARELGPHGIRCNAILPGPIDNARGRALVKRRAQAQGVTPAQAESEMLAFVSMRSWIDPSEVGKMATFLASSGARHVSGQFIGVCGNVEWDS
jgi:NAD(P)-dependent dehydrogenase (short-subunit alcohol dehydrogenase family)